MSESAVTCARQQFIDSAKPCSSSTSGAPSSPATSASKVRGGDGDGYDAGHCSQFSGGCLVGPSWRRHCGPALCALQLPAPGLASQADAKGTLLQGQWKAFPFISMQECFDAPGELAPASRAAGLPGR